MTMPHFGLTNLYLKFGLGLVALAVVLLVVFAVTSNFVVLYPAGVLFWSGVVLYIFGRVAKVRRTRTDA